MVLPERQDHAYSPLRLGSLAASSRCELRFMNQTFCPFDENQMVGEAALKQHCDPVVTGQI